MGLVGVGVPVGVGVGVGDGVGRGMQVCFEVGRVSSPTGQLELLKPNVVSWSAVPAHTCLYVNVRCCVNTGGCNPRVFYECSFV